MLVCSFSPLLENRRSRTAVDPRGWAVPKQASKFRAQIVYFVLGCCSFDSLHGLPGAKGTGITIVQGTVVRLSPPRRQQATSRPFCAEAPQQPLRQALVVGTCKRRHSMSCAGPCVPHKRASHRCVPHRRASHGHAPHRRTPHRRVSHGRTLRGSPYCAPQRCSLPVKFRKWFCGIGDFRFWHWPI